VIDYILPDNAAAELSKDSRKNIVIKKVYVMGEFNKYRYSFDLLVDGFHKIIYVDIPMDRFIEGTNVWPTIYKDLLKQIKEIPKREDL
jgi:hypothetical protein